MKLVFAFYAAFGMGTLFGAESTVPSLQCPTFSQEMLREESSPISRICVRGPQPCPPAEAGLEMVEVPDEGGTLCRLAYGPALYQYSDGSRVESNYSGGILEGASISYSGSGKKILEENFKVGVKEGKRIAWYGDTGQIKLTEVFKGGLRQGLSLHYYPNGAKKMRVGYQQGKRNGVVNEWYQNGKLKVRGKYLDGAPIGSYTEYYSNGKKRMRAQYREGVLNGTVVTWSQNGVKVSERQYRAGILHGSVADWDEQGRPEKVLFYNDGEPVGPGFAGGMPTRSPAATNGNGNGLGLTCQQVGKSLQISWAPTRAECVKVDVDGNGYLDYVFAGVPQSQKTTVALLRRGQVLSTLVVDEPRLDIYPARHSEGQFDEPASIRDGLVRWSSQGYSRIYLYDFESGSLTRSEHVTDN